MLYTGKLNFVLLLSHFAVNIGIKNIDRVVSMLFSQRQSNADEHTLTQHISDETLLGNRYWIDVILSTLFRSCFLNLETTTINIRRLIFLFSTKYESWKNTDELWGSTLFQRWCNVDMFAGSLRLSSILQKLLYDKGKPKFYKFHRKVPVLKSFLWKLQNF